MKRLIIVLVTAAWSAVAYGQKPVPKVEEITAKLNDIYRGEGSHGTMTMKVVTNRYTRELTMESWSKGEDHGLVVIRKPAREAGTASLRTPDGVWSYAPRADRMVRIPSGLMSESWMGSHFTNEDLLRESDYKNDYDSTVRWTQRDGAEYLELIMVPKAQAAVVWTKIVQLLRPNDWLPVKAEYYDEGEIVRVMTFKEIKNMNGRLLPSVMEVIPSDKPGEYTRVTYQSINFDAKVDPAIFTQMGLRRVAK